MNSPIYRITMVIKDYYCELCKRQHKVLSKIGQAHLPPLPPGDYTYQEAKP